MPHESEHHGRSKRPKVAVIGATGHTGRFVVAELARRGFAPIAIGRNSARLSEAMFRSADEVLRRQVDLTDEAALSAALDDVSAVINCAGPFLDTARHVAAAAIAARVHYLDVTAEQAAAGTIFDEFDTPARDAGVVLLPAMGFFGGFADLLVSMARGAWNEVDAVEIGIGLDSWHPTTGTRLTGERNTATRLIVADGELRPVPSPPAEREWDFHGTVGKQSVFEVPLSEIIVIHRHLKAREIHTYLSGAGLADLRNPATPPPVLADADGRSSQKFVVEAVVRRGSEQQRVVASGQDIYAFTAPLVCEAAERLIASDAYPRGARAPGEIFDTQAFLTALTSDHFDVQIRETR